MSEGRATFVPLEDALKSTDSVGLVVYPFYTQEVLQDRQYVEDIKTLFFGFPGQLFVLSPSDGHKTTLDVLFSDGSPKPSAYEGRFIMTKNRSSDVSEEYAGVLESHVEDNKPGTVYYAGGYVGTHIFTRGCLTQVMDEVRSLYPRCDNILIDGCVFDWNGQVIRKLA
jgi:hypothetical protein